MISNFPVKFGDYTLHELIGRGGMAEVYRATKAGIGGFEKPVAIKMILPHLAENEDFIAMLTDEARIIVSITHSNIAQVYDFCFDSGRYFIAMEYIHGIDVADLNKRMQKLGERVAVEHSIFIATCMCTGLHYAHTKVDKEGNLQNIVHRDVSPQNILLNYAGEVKLIDFGVAKARNRDATTQAGVIKGKLHYMAPEQAKGEEIDGRADIFAAGIVLYELLTGILPFDGETEFEIYNNLVNAEITPPSQINPQVPKELDRVVLKMLQRSRDERYPSGYAARHDLEQVLYEIAPGYTNTRLSRYIENMLDRERAIKNGLPDPGSIHYKPTTPPGRKPPSRPPRLDTDERPTIGILAEQETESTILQDKFGDDRKGNVRGSLQGGAPIPQGGIRASGTATPIDPAQSGFDASFGFDQPELSKPGNSPTISNGGLNSVTALVVFFVVGLAIIVTISFGVYYLLSPATLPFFAPPPTIADATPPTPTSPDPSSQALKVGGEQVGENLADLQKNNADAVLATVTSWAVEPDQTVVLRFRSMPSGVEVHHNGALLGTTPLVIYTEKSADPSKYTFTLEDYDDVILDITPDQDLQELVTMNLKSAKSKPTAAAAATPPTKRRSSGRKLPRKGSTGLIDPF